MEDQRAQQEAYTCRLLEAYRQTPGTTGCIRRPDRLLAAQLYQRGVPLAAVENALILAAARRMIRPADALPLGTIQSLAYFVPVIEEVLNRPMSPGYFEHLRRKIQRFCPNPATVAPADR